MASVIDRFPLAAGVLERDSTVVFIKSAKLKSIQAIRRIKKFY